jgi:hypothetical protein
MIMLVQSPGINTAQQHQIHARNTFYIIVADAMAHDGIQVAAVADYSQQYFQLNIYRFSPMGGRPMLHEYSAGEEVRHGHAEAVTLCATRLMSQNHRAIFLAVVFICDNYICKLRRFNAILVVTV